MRITIALLFLLCIASLAAAQESPPPAADIAHVNAAERLLAFERPSLAERRLKDGLKQYPGSRAIQHALASLYLGDELYNPQEAYDRYRRLVDSDGDDAQAHAGLGEAALLLAGNPDNTDKREEFSKQASGHLSKAAKLAPNQPRPLYLLGEMERTAGFELASQPGGAEQLRQRLIAARRYFEAALALDPAYTDVLFALAETLLQLCDADNAVKHLNAIASLEGESLFWHELMAKASLCLDPPSYDLFMRSCIGAMKEDPRIERQVMAALAKRAASLDNRTLASELIMVIRSVDHAPSAAARMELLKPYIPRTLKEGEERERPVVPEFCYLASDAVFHEAMWAQDGDTRKRLLEQALTFLEAARDIEELIPDIARLRAVANMRLERYEPARTAFERTAELDPSDSDALAYARAMPELAQGRLTVEQFEQFLDIRGVAMQQAERIHQLEGLAAAAPQYVALRAFLGDLLFRNGDFQRALEHYTAALETQPDSVAALLGKGRTLARIGQWKDSLTTLKQIKQSGSEEARYWMDIGERIETGTLKAEAFAKYHEAQHPAQSPTRAKECLDEALALTPAFFEALIARAELATKDKAFPLAGSLAAKALAAARNDKEKSSAHGKLADIAYASNDLPGAASGFRLARELERDNKERIASLYWLEAMSEFRSGNHVKVHSLLREATDSNIAIGPFIARPEAVELIKEGLLSTQGRSFDIAPRVLKGQVLTFHAELDIGSTGAIEQRTGASFDVVLRVLSTPAIDGIYELNVSFEGLPQIGDFSALAKLTFTMKVSPWFGLVEQPVPDGTPGYLAALPVTQA
ncbi:MAG: tetratricopeptide repeat protein, partial [Planctomycetes bacterium]|nr:tetratricopeptide repeat protein [Planctomycetota bacterium]